MVDGNVVHRGEFVPIERGAFPRNNRPRVRMSGSFASEVSSIEFPERGVDVVGVEEDARRESGRLRRSRTTPSTSVRNASGRLSRPDNAHTGQGKALATGGNDRRREIGCPAVSRRPYVRDVDISTAQDPAY